MIDLDKLRIQLFADGANIEDIRALAQKPYIKGFTTNPTLMKKAGVKSYEAFAKTILHEISDRPISFEVFADELAEMQKQAETIASWGNNVNVKIPVMNTKGESTAPIIKALSDCNIQLNVTAVMTGKQFDTTLCALNTNTNAIISVFAGRIADTGRDPVPVMSQFAKELESRPNTKLLWASPRELLNIFQANDCGCHIITVDPSILKKLHNINKDLTEFSQETVQMFYDDALAAGYSIQLK